MNKNFELKALSTDELVAVDGGGKAIDAFVGTLEIAGGVVLIGSAGFTGLAGGVAGGYAIADGIQRVFGE